MSQHMKEKSYYQREKKNARRKAEKEAREYERKIRLAQRSYGHGTTKKVFSFSNNKTQNARLNRVSDHPSFTRIYSQESLAGWKPKTKSPRGILISLIKHCHITYPVPGFLYNAFIDENYYNRDAALFTLRHLTRGGRPKDLLGTSIDSLLTKRMLHFFLSSNQPTFVRAIREAQFKAQGGDPRIFQAFVAARPQIYGKPREARYSEIISWLSKIGLLSASLITPMLDFFDDRYYNNPNYSLKGRTVNSVMDAVKEWHKELYVKNISGPEEYEALVGVDSFLYEKKKKKSSKEFYQEINIWTITPILNLKELRKEGKSLKHCVVGYNKRMVNGSCFIWSLKKDSVRQITIEVNGRKEIVQARGRYNRTPTEAEKSIIKRWAKENQIKIRLYYW